MINFNFAVKSGFAPVVVNETEIGTKVRHRNNGMFFGWIKAYLTNGKMLIETLANDEMITQMVDPEKFMVKKRNHREMMNYIGGRIDQHLINIASAVDHGNFDEYKIEKGKIENLKQYIWVVLYAWNIKNEKNAESPF